MRFIGSVSGSKVADEGNWRHDSQDCKNRSNNNSAAHLERQFLPMIVSPQILWVNRQENSPLNRELNKQAVSGGVGYQLANNRNLRY